MSAIDNCTTCNGTRNEACQDHGIDASLRRQDQFFREWDERSTTTNKEQ